LAATWIYLKPSHSSLSELEKDGTTIESRDKPSTIIVRAILEWDVIFQQKLASVTLCNLMVPLLVLNAWNLAVL